MSQAHVGIALDGRIIELATGNAGALEGELPRRHQALAVVHVDGDFDRIAEVRPLTVRRLA